MSVPFLGDRQWNIAHVPAEPLTICFFWPDCRALVFAWDIGVLRDLAIPTRKTKKTESTIIQRLGRSAINVLKFRVRFSETAWHPIYLGLDNIWFRVLNLTKYWSYAMLCSNIWVNVCSNMPWSTWEHLEEDRPEPNAPSFFIIFHPSANSWLLLTSLKACDRSGHNFGVHGMLEQLVF